MAPQFIDTTGLRPALLAGRLNYPGHSLTMIVKGTFDLIPGQAAPTCEEQVFPTGDEFYIDDEEARGGPRYNSDFAYYKPRTDVTLVGKCHAAGGKPTASCQVRFQVGDRSKSLTVFGNRDWFRHHMRWRVTEPEPFTEMELRYENSFGGSKSKGNPVGKGALPIEDEEGYEIRPLPNIEDPAHLVESPKSRPQPAGFGPLNQTWKTRQDKMGTYKGKYLETRWPWFPEDFDWTHFNAAPEDMQLEGYLRGDEKLYFENLHKVHSQYHSELPGIRIRCFVNRLEAPDSEKTEFVEVPLGLDTVWVDMEAEKLVLVWRGWTEVLDEDHEEIKDVFITSEPLAQRAASVDECYQQFLRAQSEEDGEPIEPETPAEDEAEQGAEPMDSELPGRVVDAAFLKAQTSAILAHMGVDPEQLPPELKRQQDELIERIAETDPDKAAAREIKDAKKQLRSELAKLDLDLDNLPPLSTKAQAEQGRLMKEFGIKPDDVAAPELASLFGVVSAVAPKMGMDPENLSPLIGQIKKHGLGAKEEEEEPEEVEAVPLTREEVKERATRGESFAETDLRGLDLSDLELGGLDFSAALLSGTNLAGAKFTASILEGADLTGATLTSADLTGANLAEANLTQANLEQACLESADCTTSDLTQATLTGAKLEEAVFEQARLIGAVLNEVEANGAYFVEADLTGAQFRKAKCSGADFSKAILDQANFGSADLSEASAEGAVGRKISCVGADLTKFRGSGGSNFSKGVFYKAVCPGSLWEKADLKGCDFRGAQLQGAQFTNAELDQAYLSASDARQARFSKASLRQAQMDHMNLFQGSLEKADLTEANLAASNMYGVEFLGAVIDRTHLVDANVKMTKLARKG